MKRSLTPAVTTLEDRLALSTTSPTYVVAPPVITGSIDTLTPPPTDGQLQYLGTVEAPVIAVLPTGTDQVNHFLTIVTAREFNPSAPVYPPYITSTVAYFPPQMSFYSVSQLT